MKDREEAISGRCQKKHRGYFFIRAFHPVFSGLYRFGRNARPIYSIRSSAFFSAGENGFLRFFLSAPESFCFSAKKPFFMSASLSEWAWPYLSLLGFFHIYLRRRKICQNCFQGIGRRIFRIRNFLYFGKIYRNNRRNRNSCRNVFDRNNFRFQFFNRRSYPNEIQKERRRYPKRNLEVPDEKEIPAEKKTEFVKGPDEDGKESRLNALRNRFAGPFQKEEKEEKERKRI